MAEVRVVPQGVSGLDLEGKQYSPPCRCCGRIQVYETATQRRYFKTKDCATCRILKCARPDRVGCEAKRQRAGR